MSVKCVVIMFVVLILTSCGGRGVEPPAAQGQPGVTEADPKEHSESSYANGSDISHITTITDAGGIGVTMQLARLITGRQKALGTVSLTYAEGLVLDGEIPVAALAQSSWVKTKSYVQSKKNALPILTPSDRWSDGLGELPRAKYVVRVESDAIVYDFSGVLDQ